MKITPVDGLFFSFLPHFILINEHLYSNVKIGEGELHDGEAIGGNLIPILGLDYKKKVIYTLKAVL